MIIENHDIIGGYVDCAAAVSNTLEKNPPKVLLTGTGAGNGPVITIKNTDHVSMYHFEITGGVGDLGSGVKITDAWVKLEDFIIYDNATTTNGGGINIIESFNPVHDAELFLNNTKIYNNLSLLDGGGIYCSKADIYADKDSGISVNRTIQADSNGGGLYLEYCKLRFFGGTNKAVDSIDIESYKGISNNSTTGHGGGIYALSSEVYLMGGHYNMGEFNNLGFEGTPLNLNHNTADSDLNNDGNGGGVYVKGQLLGPASLEVHRGKVQFNSAYNGGAFYVGENTSFIMSKSRLTLPQEQVPHDHVDPCWSQKCNVLSHNSAKRLGGALYIEGGSNSIIGQTYITDNRANFGTVISLDSTDSNNDIHLYQNFIYHNGRDGMGDFLDRNVFEIYNNSPSPLSGFSSLNIELNTIVDNHTTSSVFKLKGANNHLKVLSSILDDHTTPQIGDLTGSTSSALFDCIIVNETASIGVSFATLTRIEVSDPGFEIRNYDYHIKPDSNAIDFCDDSLSGRTQLLTTDIDGQSRPVDDTHVTEFYGSWDLGADEGYQWPIDQRDTIFIDSFDWD